METQSPAWKHSEEKLSAIPGSSSLTTFTLRRVETVENPCSFMVTNGLDGNAIIKKSLKHGHRPWLVHDQIQCEEEADSKQHYMNASPIGCLPKGVIRGCSGCSNCQKVSARWDPEGARSCTLEEAPVFYPNEEEFKDTFKYIESIRQRVEPFGFCRIMPPSSWQPPCFLEESDVWQTYKFPTRVERVNELPNNWPCGKASADEELRETKRRRLAYGHGDDCDGAKSFQFESGPQFTLIAFKRYADYFQLHYFSRGSDAKVVSNMRREEPKLTEQNIEGEYWRIVEKPTEEIEVLHGVDLDFRSLDREFPASSKPEQASDLEENSTSGWNMNNISSLPWSLLSFGESDSSLILTPRLHIGMCFSSFPWMVEEHHLYKLCYLHIGAPRIWYGTSGCDPYIVDVFLDMQLHDSSEEHPEHHRKPGRQVSPAALKLKNIPVHRCIQRPREFVLFLPGAYHSGFDCGFNCSVSSVFAPLEWLPHGLNSVELYREHKWKTSFSYDKLLLRAASEVIKSRWQWLVMGKKDCSDGNRVLAKTLKARIGLETRYREYLSSASQSRKMDKSFDADDLRKECNLCYYDLYLSAASCPCTPNKFSCLKHAKYLCSCSWRERIFHFRFLVTELNTLLEAVKGKLRAIQSWVKEDGPDGNKHRSVEQPSDGRTMGVGKDKPSILGSFLKEKSPMGEMSLGSRKGKDFDTAMDSAHGDDSTDDTSSMSSFEADIEAYVAELESRHMRKKSRGSGGNQQNVDVSNEAEHSSGNIATTSEKDEEASLLKLLSGPLRSGSLKEIDLDNVSDDPDSSSSESDVDVEAYIERLVSRRNRC